MLERHLNEDGWKHIYTPTLRTSKRVIVRHWQWGKNERVHPGVMFHSQLIEAGANQHL